MKKTKQFSQFSQVVSSRFSKVVSFLIIAFYAILFSKTSHAQCSPGAGCFIKGDYVEVGVSTTGAFGACTPPSGYHNNVVQFACSGTGTTLGFVSDPDKDGWLVSSPGRSPYMGDYFVPGGPYEGWDLQYNGGATSRYRNNASFGVCPGSSCSNISYVATASEQTTTWQGTNGPLTITQKTVVKKDKLYFVVYVDIVNSGSINANNVYYFRGLDPDNEQTITGNYETINTIVYQPNTISKNCLVKANGKTYGTQSYLGLGSKDCRAKACIFTNWPLSVALSDLYSQSGPAATTSGYYYNVGSTTTTDIAIGIVFNLGTLVPGQQTSLAFTYILKESDLDSALNETSPKFESSGSPYSPYSTFRLCPGKKINLKVINGGQYKWVWTPGTYMVPIGTSTNIPIGGTIPTITGSKVYPLGGVYGDSVEVTVWGPMTYTATGYSNCDTQTLIFYVDTISFSVPPSIVTPIRYCEGETPSILSAAGASGATINWYNTSTGGTPSSTAPTPSTIFSGTGDFDTTTYWVSQTNLAGCETPRAKIDVIVTKKPSAPVTSDTVYCIGSKTDALSANGLNLKWYDALTGGTRYSNTPVPTSTSPGITTYYVSQSNNGCESDRSPLSVEISKVTASFDMSDDSLCGSESIILTNTSTTTSIGSYKSNWELGDGSSRTDSNISHQYKDVRNTYKIILSITNPYGCKDSISKVVEVFKKPIISMKSSDTMICQGESITFNGVVTPGYSSLYWDFGDGDPSYNVLSVQHSFKKSGNFNIQLKTTYPACEGTATGITIRSIEVPLVDIGSDTTVCIGNKSIILTNRHLYPTHNYLWNTGDTTRSISVKNEGYYSLRVVNWKCSASDSITVTKGCYLDIPNAFSPGNGLDYSNYFMPRSSINGTILTFDMQIFNRWGQLIFETDKVNGKGWDGKYKGVDQPFGVYVYIIRVSFSNGVSEDYNGNVTLIR